MMWRNMRIVSLIASSTEIVCALGCLDQLVGRSHECDFPPAVCALPVCTEPKFNIEGSSYQIDERIKAILQEGVSVYRVDAAQLDALAPDLILTQTQCEVCAVSLRDVEEAACQLIGSRPQIVSLEPNALADVWADIARVAAALHRDEQGEVLIATLQRRMHDIEKTAAALPTRPTIACIEWIEPLMAAGNWMPELVSMAGGRHLFGEAGAHSPWLTWDALATVDPEVILVLPCGYDISKTRHEMGPLRKQAGWQELRAVQHGRVFLADGSQFFNRPGPRLVESLEILAELIHPEAFHFGHKGCGWEPL